MQTKKESKGTLLFLHGNSSSARVFAPVIQSGRIPYRYVSPDLPGHGNATNQTLPENYNYQSLQDFALSLANEDGAGVMIVGNSLGGHLAIDISPRVKRLRGIMLSGTPPLKKPYNLTEAFNPLPELSIFFSEYAEEHEIRKAASVTLFDRANIPFIVEDFLKTRPEFRREQAGAIANGMIPDEVQILKNLNVPIFVLQGQTDPTVNMEYLYSLRDVEHIPLQISILEKAGHFPSLDNPEGFTDALLKAAEVAFGNV